MGYSWPWARGKETNWAGGGGFGGLNRGRPRRTVLEGSGLRRGVLAMAAKSQITFVISGYYGFDNIGDEAVLAALLQQLRCLAPGCRAIVLSGDPAGTAAEHGVEAVCSRDLKAVGRALRQGTVFISGGGTLFQDTTSSRSLYYYLMMIAAARAYRLPVVIYGQGIGPLSSRWNRLLTRQVLQLASLVIVRDREAYQELRTWGFDETRLCLGADPVISLRAEPGGSLGSDQGGRSQEPGSLLRRGLGDRFLPGRPVLLVSLRPWPLLDASLPAIAAALDQLVRRAWQVVFIPFQFSADYPVCRRCADWMEEAAFVWPEALDVQEAFALFGEADYCLGMRLHALIFAAVHRVPMLGLVYDPKVASFLQELGLPEAALHLPPVEGRTLDGRDLLVGLQHLEAERKRLSRQIGVKTEEMAARLAAANSRLQEQLAPVGVKE